MQSAVSRSILRACAITFALTLVPSLLPAQDQKPSWLFVVTYQVRPEMRTEFESAQKDFSAACKKTKIPFRSVWSNVFGENNEYIATMPVDNFAAFDGTGFPQGAIGKTAFAAYGKRLRPTVTGVRLMILVARPDLGIGNGPAQPEDFAVISRITAAAGREMDLDNWIKSEFNPAMKQGGVKQIWAFQAIFGSDGPNYISVMPIDKLAVIDRGHPAWGMEGGRAAANQMFAKTKDLITSADANVIRLRRDLSYLPAPSSASTSQ